MNTLEWLTHLVSFDTTSRNSNLALINNIKDYLQTHQIDSHLTYDDTKQKANLFATIPATNQTLAGGIILSGHTDVVPVDQQDWKTNPFEATQIGTRIYGRGTSDMKGFIAAALALVPDFIQLKLAHPIHLAFSYDEEVGCIGAPRLIAQMQEQGIQPKACIVGEPSSMQPVIAHKGIQVYRVRVHGLAAHSSLTPQGCNAIDYAAMLINYIRKIADEIRQSGPFDSHYDVPFTTISTNMITGGNAHNTIPETAEFIFELRNLPNVSPTELLARIQTFINETLIPEMRKTAKETNIQIERLGQAPSFEGNDEAMITQLTRSLCQNNETLKVAYATEAGLFSKAQIPTIICGPGSIEQAHRANEFVEVSQLQSCTDFLRSVVKLH